VSIDDEAVDRSLGRLDSPAGAKWREPGDLKRTAVRRKRAKLAALSAGGLALATAVTLAVALPRGSSHAGVHVAAGLHAAARQGDAVQLVANSKPLNATPGGAQEQAVADAEQAFTLALLKQTNKDGGRDNVVLSPSSLAIALSMLQNGAVGATRDEIAKTLQTPGLTSEQQDAGWASLTADLAKSGKDSGVTVESANSLWLQQNLPMAPQFMQVMQRYFQTGVWQVDFAQNLSGAERAINAWVSDKTHGKITSLFNRGDIDRSTLLVLANAVFFKASWQYKFDPKLTADGTFQTAHGGVSVPFMRYGVDEPTLAVAQTAAYDAVELPYTGGRFAALVVMPKERSLTDFVSTLTPASLGRLTNSMSTGEVDLRVPRFTTTDYRVLNHTLARMGMQTAFSPAADFSGLSKVGLQVQVVAQRAFLKLDETGTEAAAVTGIGMVPTSSVVAQPLTFDHPFLFLVRDAKTGAIVFSAQIQNPAG
jgi:serpin B